MHLNNNCQYELKEKGPKIRIHQSILMFELQPNIAGCANFFSHYSFLYNGATFKYRNVTIIIRSQNEHSTNCTHTYILFYDMNCNIYVEYFDWHWLYRYLYNILVVMENNLKSVTDNVELEFEPGYFNIMHMIHNGLIGMPHDPLHQCRRVWSIIHLVNYKYRSDSSDLRCWYQI